MKGLDEKMAKLDKMASTQMNVFLENMKQEAYWVDCRERTRVYKKEGATNQDIQDTLKLTHHSAPLEEFFTNPPLNKALGEYRVNKITDVLLWSMPKMKITGDELAVTTPAQGSAGEPIFFQTQLRDPYLSEKSNRKVIDLAIHHVKKFDVTLCVMVKGV